MPYDAAATPPPGSRRMDNRAIDLRLVYPSKHISLGFHLCCAAWVAVIAMGGVIV